MNGDGYSDVIIGAYGFDNGETNEGRTFVYLGSAAGPANAPVWIGEGGQDGAFYGYSVGTAGDVNGDGFSDVIVGSYLYDNGETDEGRAFVYHGEAADLAASAAWTGESNQASSIFGSSVATAGDVNGDGYSDVIVGAAYYSNGQISEGRVFVYHGTPGGLAVTPAWTAENDTDFSNLGHSVGTAGDVNGDGYSDVLMGAPHINPPGTGRAYVYHGSAAGLAATPAWTAEGDSIGTHFGFSIGTAGDVNGDGYSDVIVGEDGDERVLVYHGSAAGLSAAPAWTAEGPLNQGFGRSVGTAGDVEGDGYCDVIVGVPFQSNGQVAEGRALVYRGSAAGLAASPTWTAESNQSDSNFGLAVATAGDVNGDGYSDVIVDAPFYTNGETSEGRVFAYHGSPVGLATAPAWTAEGNQSGAFFGESLGTAGDVNGDGFSDVIIGAYGYANAEGRAFVYHGSASGLPPTPAWTGEINQSVALFGWSVGMAGDVNGDAFSDVIVGARQYDNGQVDEGGAFAYLGNAGDGLDRIARQVRTDDSAPIWPLGNSDSESAFRLKALGRTPAGRGKVQFQYEVKPAGVPFDGTGLVTGPVTNTGTPGAEGSAVPLSELASGLTPESLYHWRLRIISDSPFFPRSPWLWLPYNAVTEADVRTGEGTTGVAEGAASPARTLRLGPSAPNPFAARTQFTYTLVQDGGHRLAVYDVQGRQVAMLADRVQPAGQYIGSWDGRNARGNELPSGIYFLRLDQDGQVEHEKLVITR